MLNSQLILAISVDVLLGIAALGASFAGVVLTITSVRANRKDATARAEQECHEKLLQAQREAEGLSDQVHELRIKKDME